MKIAVSLTVGILLLMMLCYAGLFWVQGSGDDDLADLSPDVYTPARDASDGWVYGKIFYVHDILDPNCYFMLLRAHPGAPVPLIEGGYATTDVWVTVKLRGVVVPRALQDKLSRNRPHDWLDRERARWDKSMRYVWSVAGPKKTFKVYNLKVLKEDKILEADLEFLLGGQWHLLAVAMLNDKKALPAGEEWDFGDEEFGPMNPNIPK